MNNKLKDAFGQIQAEESLKNSTKTFLAQKTQGYSKGVKRPFHVCAAACLCLILLLIGGQWIYFTPTSAISIDINPSLELGINRFDRVISVNGLNDDGQALANVLDIKFKNYTDAINLILENENITFLLSNDEIMTITVTGPDESQSAEILSDIEVCTSEHKNTYCHYSPPAEVSAAHESGLSCGKYRAFLELQAFDPNITPEAIQGMTMREIRDLIDSLSTDTENETSSDKDRDYGHHGSENSHRDGQEKKQGNDK